LMLVGLKNRSAIVAGTNQDFHQISFSRDELNKCGSFTSQQNFRL
jgi:hypothetical protein